MGKNPGQKQQGDVTFERIDALPRKAKRKFSRIIRRGEATGHHHAIADRKEVELFSFTNPDSEIEELFVEVKKEFATITHQEHGSVILEKGIHKIGVVREINWFADLRRRKSQFVGD